MPVKACREGGKPGFKCGDQGKCYTYTSGNEAGRKRAKKKAINQCIAIGEPPGEAELRDAGYDDVTIQLLKDISQYPKEFWFGPDNCEDC